MIYVHVKWFVYSIQTGLKHLGTNTKTQLSHQKYLSGQPIWYMVTVSLAIFSKGPTHRILCLFAF